MCIYTLYRWESTDGAMTVHCNHKNCHGSGQFCVTDARVCLDDKCCQTGDFLEVFGFLFSMF